ncbi:MAG: hypothetical protein ACI88H_001495 [Cocleimonas sp.]|jgi:hypothetical protein|uniref:hypothetical protein n=1 Tax=uncultured Shewanella sp. TaxID=173975 RepID=UPI003703AFDE
MEAFICWLNTNIALETIKTILASAPGIILVGFSLYFAYQKILNKILVTYSIVSEGVTETRISEISLINKKNKPVTIFSIQAVINKDIIVEVESFKPALILKPLESVHIDTLPFSSLHLGADHYKAEYMTPNQVDIFLITDSKKIKCELIDSPRLSSHFDFKHFKQATKKTRTYNGKVFNDSVKYAIVYNYGSEERTAFVGISGHISEDWGFRYNSIEKSSMGNKEDVRKYLVAIGYDKIFDGLVVEDINER